MPDKEWSYPDGMKVTEHENGSVTVKYPDGSSMHVDPSNGDRVDELPTPGGLIPVPVQPTQPPKDKDGGAERRISYPDGTRVTIFRGPPRCIRVTRSAPVQPRHLDVDFGNGVRQITVQPTQDVPDPQPQKTRPEPAEPREISPSTHPKPPEGSKKKKKVVRKRPTKPRRKAAPKRKRR